jgi:2,3-bisphosphoglycerate-dependent phosphoglycerate mutase
MTSDLTSIVSGAATLLLIRHADTGERRRLCGSYDVPIDNKGRRQLESLCRRPALYPPPDALYASTLLRARQVGEALARAWGVDLRLEDDLREIHCGDFEGVELSELQRTHPDVWARNQAQSDEAFGWPGGESYREFHRRVIRQLARIAADHPGQRIAIVTHTGVITQVLAAVKGRSPARWDADRADPLTGTEVAWSNGRPATVLRFNVRDWY